LIEKVGVQTLHKAALSILAQIFNKHFDTSQIKNVFTQIISAHPAVEMLDVIEAFAKVNLYLCVSLVTSEDILSADMTVNFLTKKLPLDQDKVQAEELISLVRREKHIPLLHCLVNHKYRNILTALLKNSPNCVNDVRFCFKSFKWTALMWACFSESLKGHDIDLIIELLDQGADIDLQDNHGFTALMWELATTADNAIVELLLKRGADVNHQSIHGFTPLTLACSKDVQAMPDTRTVQTLLNYSQNLRLWDIDKSDRSPLIAARKSQRFDIEQLLINHKQTLLSAWVSRTFSGAVLDSIIAEL
jgi:hypothetical protein